MLDMLIMTESAEQRALISLCGLCGLRVTEARTVTVNCVDQSAMMLTVPGKGYKTRVVPISTVAWGFIRPRYEWLVAQQGWNAPLVDYSDRGARRILKQLAARAGLSVDLASHDLRATFATAAYNKCKDLRVVQELLGHSSSDTTECYTGVRVAAMKAAAEVV